MSWTELEYRLIKFQGLHRYNASANPDKVGLGRCGCGVNMYYCEHAVHFARALIEELELPNPPPPESPRRKSQAFNN